MDEISVLEPEEFRSSPLPEPQIWQVLAVLVAMFLAMNMASAMIFMVISKLMGWNPDLMSGHFSADAGAGERWEMRLLLSLNHLMGFVVSGWLTVWIFYRRQPGWMAYLQADRPAAGKNIWLAVGMMVAAIPLTLFLYGINKALPLPDVFRDMENQTAEALKGLLQMDSPVELLANLLLIALLPAIGEELIFRGILQQQLMRRMSNPWVAILWTAAIFSFIHFQFEGFFPRMLLGVLLGWMYWRTRNFWVPVAAHFFNNGVQVLGQYLYGQKMTQIDLEQDVDMPWYWALVSVGLIYLIWRLFERINE